MGAAPCMAERTASIEGGSGAEKAATRETRGLERRAYGRAGKREGCWGGVGWGGGGEVEGGRVGGL